MELIGVLSNPVGPLKTLLDGATKDAPESRQINSSVARRSEAIGARHRRPGWIVEAIVRVLADRPEPMQARAIHAAVEALLGRSVRWGSVKGSLASNVSGSTPRFMRVARGSYRLR
jgi:hypothetical protein